ncbi:Ig domain-containing protein [Clostridium botulinum]|nr:Ig domain-containing protein [Clostridium botulinum]
MKNCYKRILIMFVMVLTIMGIGAIQNGIKANASTIGDQLLQPEEGWRRYDDTDKNIKYTDNFFLVNNYECFNETAHQVGRSSSPEYIKLKFYGSKIRIISILCNAYPECAYIKIDGIEYNFKINGDTKYNVLAFEKNDLRNTSHTVEIIQKDINYQIGFVLDAIDINEDGELLQYTEQAQSISLNKSSLNLKEGTSEKLTATTTPSAVDIDWSSSDEAVATIDSNGNVKAIKEGQATITAQIKGTDVKATCEVIVTKEDIVKPEEPSIENGSLYIEMVDGNIKRADKSQIEKFKKWFISRDLDETESPIFKITNAKGNTEYLVHDKVVGFEIRE